MELPEDVLRRLSIKLLVDLKEARERLKQTSRNSSRPPSSDAPWSDANATDGQADTTPADEPEPTDELSPDNDEASRPAKKDSPIQEEMPVDPGQRKAGKQPGAPGYGREQKIVVTAEHAHYPSHCVRCDSVLTRDAAKAYTAFETVDIEWSDPVNPGLRLTNTKHIYYQSDCALRHCTQQVPHRQVSDVLTPDIYLSEWRLVGPGLAALIVCLAYRMRLSRAHPRIPA